MSSLAFLTTFVDSPEPPSSSVRSNFNQADRVANSSDLNSVPSLEDQDLDSGSSDWVDSNPEVEDSHYEELDEEMQLELVAMEDGTSDGFDSNVFHHVKF